MHETGIETLLGQADWVWRVARQLVDDPEEAEDVAQEAWLTALRNGPLSVRNLRGWLASRVRTVVHSRRRTAERTRRREAAVARPDRARSTEALIEEAALQRELVDAVWRLGEPFRSIVILRFFHDLPPRVIAERLGIPRATVGSRLARALARLRESMDARPGGRGAWAPLVFMVLGSEAARGAVPTIGLGAGALLVKAKLGIAALVVTLAAVAVFNRPWSGDDGEGLTEFGPKEVVASRDARRALPRPAPTQTDAPVTGEAVGAPPEGVAPKSKGGPGSPKPSALRGMVFGLDGAGIPGVAVVDLARPEQIIGVTDGTGVFTGMVEGERATLVVATSGWTTVARARVDAANLDREQVLVAAPSIDLEGRVVDRNGVAIPGARLDVRLPFRTLVGMPRPLDSCEIVSVQTVTDASGRFALRDIPGGPDHPLLYTVHRRYVQQQRPLPDRTERDLLIELADVGPDDRPVLTGIVNHENGMPAEGAAVRLGGHSTTTDGAGNFRLPYGRVPHDLPLVVTMAGLQPAILADFGARLSASEGREFVDVVLGPPAREIGGRVVLADGAPAVGWVVALVDPTQASRYAFPVLGVEDLIRGSRDAVVTDVEGRFLLEGLVDRAYGVKAYDKKTLLSVRAEDVPAGTTDLILQIPGDAWVENLQGRIIIKSGRPVANVRVMLAMPLEETDYGVSWSSGKKTVADANGVFQFPRAPKRGAGLRIDGPTVMPTDHRLGELEDGEIVVVTVARRRHFKIEPEGESADYDVVRFLDVDGETVWIAQFINGGYASLREAPLEDGRSGALAISDIAVFVVASRGGEELRRRRIDWPDEDGIVTIRP